MMMSSLETLCELQYTCDYWISTDNLEMWIIQNYFIFIRHYYHSQCVGESGWYMLCVTALCRQLITEHERHNTVKHGRNMKGGLAEVKDSFSSTCVCNNV
jgi:hypothetical protein